MANVFRYRDGSITSEPEPEGWFDALDQADASNRMAFGIFAEEGGLTPAGARILLLPEDFGFIVELVTRSGVAKQVRCDTEG
jgi:hypothetical protein